MPRQVFVLLGYVRDQVVVPEAQLGEWRIGGEDPWRTVASPSQESARIGLVACLLQNCRLMLSWPKHI